MKKIIIAVAAIIGFNGVANAQNNNASSTAQQTVQLALSNALDITFVTGNSATGNMVTLPFTTTDHYQNGVESAPQQLKVRSNKNFSVSVATTAANFTTSNTGGSNSVTMPVSVLSVAVTENNAGGTLGAGFQSMAFKPLSNSAADLIVGASNGGNQTFSVKYKATPGFTYPAGTYTTEVVYTATQQ